MPSGGFDLAGQPVATGTLGFVHAGRAATHDQDAIPRANLGVDLFPKGFGVELRCVGGGPINQGGGPASLLQHARRAGAR